MWAYQNGVSQQGKLFLKGEQVKDYEDKLFSLEKNMHNHLQQDQECVLRQ